MKKIVIIALGLFSLYISDAQAPAENETAKLTIGNIVSMPSSISEPLNYINTKAVRNFYNQYGDDKNETWYTTSYGFRAKYNASGIAVMADYNRKGGWLSTIKTCTEKDLPVGIRQKIKRAFPGYIVFLVKEINNDEDTVYLISIENTACWKTISVAGDSIQKMGQWEK